MQLLHCLLHSYLPYSTAVHYGIHYSSAAICHRSLPLSNFFVGLILYLVVFAPFEIIRSSQRRKLEAQSFSCRKQFRYGSGWGGCYQCPCPQDVVEYSCFGEWKRFAYVQRRESSGKNVPTLHRCISVTDDIKINEQNKSIGIGPLYLQTEFEAI